LTGLDAPTVSALLAARIDELARVLLPQGKAVSGCWRVGNLSGERGGSLSIALSGNHQGRWRDFATGEGGDALDLVEAVRRCSTAAALGWSRRWLSRYGGSAPAPAPKVGDGDDDAYRIKMALAIWDEAVSPRHTLVDTYLSGRALKLTDSLANDVIRYHPRCPWNDEAGRSLRVPAMVVAMRSIATGDITGIQRTRLLPEAKKIERRMLGIAGGAAVKLDADERVTDRLIIGEGVETCMSARQIGLRPTWALGSAGAIENFPVLDGIARLAILAEQDEANKRAIEACGGRWHDAGCEVFIIRPTSGNDLNDALREMRRSLRSASGRRRAS
jgi:Toprim domain-containing protein